MDGKSLQGWHPLEAGKPNQWQTAAAVTLSPQDPHLFAIKPGKGIIVNGSHGNTVNLLSDWKHGDVEAHVEFAVSKNSNSGVYFMGLYEIQILDSYGKTDLTFIDCGSVYARWINEKNVGGELPESTSAGLQGSGRPSMFNSVLRGLTATGRKPRTPGSLELSTTA